MLNSWWVSDWRIQCPWHTLVNGYHAKEDGTLNIHPINQCFVCLEMSPIFCTTKMRMSKETRGSRVTSHCQWSFPSWRIIPANLGKWPFDWPKSSYPLRSDVYPMKYPVIFCYLAYQLTLLYHSSSNIHIYIYIYIIIHTCLELIMPYSYPINIAQSMQLISSCSKKYR